MPIPLSNSFESVFMAILLAYKVKKVYSNPLFQGCAPVCEKYIEPCRTLSKAPMTIWD